jgi:GT2 family glycosyltransferase
MSEPSVSIIVPVADGGATFVDCLAALARLNPPPHELIVVDDGSADGSAERAGAAEARVVRMARRAGPAAARNRGASTATGEVILFVDADVLVRPDTVSHVQRAMTDRAVTGMIGSYDAEPTAPGLVSQYKNLVHRYVHQTSGPDAFTFWGACGAVRREAFLALGGFDERYVAPSIEDIELGYRLCRAGHRIRLDPTLEVTHAKRWTLTSWIHTDVFLRAMPWSELLLREGRLDDGLNLRVATRVCIMLAWTALVAMPATVAVDGAWRVASVAAVCLVLLDLPLWRYFARLRGMWFTLRVAPLHWLYYVYSGAAFALAATRHVASTGARRVEPAA